MKNWIKAFGILLLIVIIISLITLGIIYFTKLIGDFMSESEDLSYYKCIFDGSWPSAVGILTETLEKVKKIKADEKTI